MGCNFVANAAQSDWAIYVTAPSREYNKSTYGNVTNYFVYVDANIIVDKTPTGQRIFEDQISEKGGHTHNFEQAACDAYKQISPKISKIIKEQIQEWWNSAFADFCKIMYFGYAEICKIVRFDCGKIL